MYKIPKYEETKLKTEPLTEGETIENKVTRLIQNKEPIKDGAPLIFTDRKEGVNAAYNIRTDRWEIAVDALTRLEKSKTAQRDELMKPEGAEKEAKIIKMDGKPESTQGQKQG